MTARRILAGGAILGATAADFAAWYFGGTWALLVVSWALAILVLVPALEAWAPSADGAPPGSRR